MKETVRELSFRLKQVHKRFLELERQRAEIDLERRLTSFDFLLYLTQDYRFKWLQPFSALIAEMDAFLDESEVITKEDFDRIHRQIKDLLNKPGSKMAARYDEYVAKDPEFLFAQGSLNEFVNSNKMPNLEP